MRLVWEWIKSWFIHSAPITFRCEYCDREIMTTSDTIYHTVVAHLGTDEHKINRATKEAQNGR